MSKRCSVNIYVLSSIRLFLRYRIEQDEGLTPLGFEGRGRHLATTQGFDCLGPIAMDPTIAGASFLLQYMQPVFFHQPSRHAKKSTAMVSTRLAQQKTVFTSMKRSIQSSSPQTGTKEAPVVFMTLSSATSLRASYAFHSLALRNNCHSTLLVSLISCIPASITRSSVMPKDKRSPTFNASARMASGFGKKPNLSLSSTSRSGTEPRP